MEETIPAAFDVTSGDDTVLAGITADSGGGGCLETTELAEVVQLDLGATDQSCPKEVPDGRLTAIRWRLSHPRILSLVISNIMNGLRLGA